MLNEKFLLQEEIKVGRDVGARSSIVNGTKFKVDVEGDHRNRLESKDPKMEPNFRGRCRRRS